MSPSFGRTGWCQNIAHSDYLHVIDEGCVEPTTLQDRIYEMRDAASAGSMEGLADRINELREKAAESAFWSIVSGINPKKE